MKKLFIFAIFGVASVLTGCGAMANMSSQDAYNVGYGAGTILRAITQVKETNSPEFEQIVAVGDIKNGYDPILPNQTKNDNKDDIFGKF